MLDDGDGSGERVVDTLGEIKAETLSVTVARFVAGIVASAVSVCEAIAEREALLE